MPINIRDPPQPALTTIYLDDGHVEIFAPSSLEPNGSRQESPLAASSTGPIGTDPLKSTTQSGSPLSIFYGGESQSTSTNGSIATSTSELTTTSDTEPSSFSAAVNRPSSSNSPATTIRSPSTGSPSPTVALPSSSDSSSDSSPSATRFLSSGSTPAGIDAGIGLASGIVIVLLAIIVFLIYRQRKRRAQDKIGSIPPGTGELWSKPELPGHSVVRIEARRISAVELEARRAAPAELETVERSQELQI